MQTLGLAYTSASRSAFITGLSVVLVPVLGPLLGRRPRGSAEQQNCGGSHERRAAQGHGACAPRVNKGELRSVLHSVYLNGS